MNPLKRYIEQALNTTRMSYSLAPQSCHLCQFSAEGKIILYCSHSCPYTQNNLHHLLPSLIFIKSNEVVVTGSVYFRCSHVQVQNQYQFVVLNSYATISSVPVLGNDRAHCIRWLGLRSLTTHINRTKEI